MEPQIQYAKTTDGFSIAYWTLGDGPPLVQVPGPVSHIQLEWKSEGNRLWYERLAEKHKLIRYDPRGFGMSDREVTDLSLDVRLLDLEAVVDRLGLERFALLGVLHNGPVAIAYAARHPERVTHLILWCSSSRGADMSSKELKAARAVMDLDWETFTETLARVVFGWSAGDSADKFAALIREAVSPEVIAIAVSSTFELDVTPLLPQVACPTLVVNRREALYPSQDASRRLVSEIPDARLAILEGGAMAPWVGDLDSVVNAAYEFLGDEETKPAQSARDVHTILFTDVEGSTSLTDRLGDAKAREVLREHERITREALKEHGGAEIKTMGDGFMASFSSATGALECAVALQRSFEARNRGLEGQGDRPEPIRIRIGLNAGEPIAEDDPGGRGDLFGTSVNLAARIAAKAEGGEILASNVVRELVAGKGFLFSDRGETELRGFEDPVRVYEVRWRDG